MGERRRGLPTGERLAVVRLGEGDLDEVLEVYSDNRRFFSTVAGVDTPPVEHVLADMREAPPGHEAGKHFLGLRLRTSGVLVGVADVLVDYPEPGRGCFGLLLLAERHQSRGFGRESADLIERFASATHGVRDLIVGVELANEGARLFWRRRGYVPTGEQFETSPLGRTQPAEVLAKRLPETGGEGHLETCR
ncbi:GNAT family N-acetyltransferase [Myxococcota bacterium]|nr:GNAT family N-acetyltransferase [Myxococcota bacterium]